MKIPLFRRRLMVACGLDVGLELMDFSREQTVRLCIELGIPSPLAAFLIIITRSTSDSLSDLLLGFPLFVFIAYTFGIVPSMLYALLMEVWFRNDCHNRFGLLLTTAYSGVLGAAAGFVIQIFPVQESGFTYLITIGGIVGLLIGLFLCRYSQRKTK